jgi:hypothetical protein
MSTAPSPTSNDVTWIKNSVTGDGRQPVSSTDHGILVRLSKESNGEFRFRLESERDGSAYIRTESSASSGWQRSHFHLSLFETYIVQSGTMYVAELKPGRTGQDIDDVTLTKYSKDEIYTTPIGVHHNVFLADETIIHTVKHGDGLTNDWHRSELLDEYIANHLRTPHIAAGKLDYSVLESRFERPTSQDAALKDSRYEQEPRGQYNSDYRHFDQIMWQSPPWALGVFFFFVTATSGPLEKRLLLEKHTREDACTQGNCNSIVVNDDLEWLPSFDFFTLLNSTPLLVTSLAMYMISHGFFRFHRRQTSFGNRSVLHRELLGSSTGRISAINILKFSILKFFSASNIMQFMYLMFSATMLSTTLLIANVPFAMSLCLSVSTSLLIALLYFHRIYFASPIAAKESS